MLRFIILLTLTSIYVNAKPFFSKKQIDCAKTESCYLINYMDISQCQQKEKESCYDMANCPSDVCTIQDTHVDDTDRPIYAAKTNYMDCKLYEPFDGQEDDCRSIIAYRDIGTIENQVLEPLLCTDKTYTPYYALKSEFEIEGEGYFAYCTKHLGYAQKTIKALKIDNNLKAAKEAAKLAEEQAQAEKKAAYDAAKEAIKSAKGKIKKLSKAELDAVLEAVTVVLGE